MLLLPPYVGLNTFLFFFTFIATFDFIVYTAFTQFLLYETEGAKQLWHSSLVPKLFLSVTLPSLEKRKSFLYKTSCESH